MIIVHAGFWEERLWFWGEAAPAVAGPAAKAKGAAAKGEGGKAKASKKCRKAIKVLPLPYDAGSERLAQAFQAGGLLTGSHGGEPDRLVVWLPSRGGEPWPSSPLIAEATVYEPKRSWPPWPPPAMEKGETAVQGGSFEEQEGEPAAPAKNGLHGKGGESEDELRPNEKTAGAVLTPWQVGVLGLTATQEVEVLAGMVGRDLVVPGVFPGRDLRFWVEVLRLAGALVAKQQYLPALAKSGEGWRAGWRAVLTGADGALPARFAAAMPQVAHALSREAAGPPERTAQGLVLAFLHRLVDQLVRGTEAPSRTVAARGRERKPTADTFHSLHDQWLYALRSPDGRMSGAEAELAQLAAEIERWQRSVTALAAAPFRLCFRLEEPGVELEGPDELPAPNGHWYLRYLLQAVDDPSLLIPTEDAWNPGKRLAAMFNHKGFQGREYLLRSLGQSVRLWPHLEDSLRTAAPVGCQLNVQGAFEFLTDKAMLLEGAGFGVLLPAWWTGRGTKVRLAARARVKSPKMQAGSTLGLDALVKFHWELALGEEKLTLAELKELVKLKTPLVKMRGQWVQLNAAEIQAAMELWKHKGKDQTSLRDLIRLGLGGGKVPAGVDFAGLTAEGWLGDLLGQLEGEQAFTELPPPADFGGVLRPYQVRGYSWLNFLRQWGLGACLADDMGLGKTVQTLALLAHDRQTEPRGPVLLVCPTSVLGNWQKEAARFTPTLPVMVHHGLERRKGKFLAKEVQKQALVVTSYGILQRDVQLLQKIPWAGVVLDEAHNIKNPETKQARAARALPAGYRLALTGTPMENHVGDLWSLMEFLNPGFLGSQAGFKRRFFLPIQMGRDQAAARDLKRLTGPFILRRLKTDKQVIDDLPDKNEMKVYCTLTREQASLYGAVVQEAAPGFMEAQGMARKGMILAMLTKLKQVCNHPAHFLADNSPLLGRSGKLSRLTEMLEEVLAVKERALIFTQFAEMGQLLRRHLLESFGREVLFLHGGVPKKQRDLMVARFQEEDSHLPFFLLSLKAGGTGLNLIGANHVFHFDRWWNPAVENQATDRAFRIGQTKDVLVHKFLCLGTLEEKIDELLERKQAVAEEVVGSGEGWLTELSNEALKELMTLRPEAVGE